jgi:dolichol-phosphate mannosyltransferase
MMKPSAYYSQVDSVLFNGLTENLIEKEDITIVVPTLNEEKAIELVLNDLVLGGYPNILVIDGNSIDDTVNIVKKLKISVHPQVGRGKTGAIKTALNYIKTPYFVVIDGDYTYSVRDIEALLDMAPYYNQVIGARRDRNNIKRLNRFGNQMINLLFNYSFGSSLTDVCSGLYILNTSFAKNLTLETGGFDVEVEIAAQAAESNKIAECPISYGSRIGMQKLNPIRDGFRIVSSILRLGRRYNPLLFYSSIIGLILTAAGVGFTIFDIFASLHNLSFPIANLLSTLFMGAGIQILILSVVLSQLKYITKKQISKK